MERLKDRWFTLACGMLGCLLVAFLIYGVMVTNNENISYAEDYSTYNYAINKLSQNNVDRQTISYFQDLHNKYPNDYLITSNLGSLYLKGQDPEKAIHFFQLALDQRIYLVRDTSFMLQYGKALSLVHKDQEAKAVLERALKNPDVASYQSEINALLKTIQEGSE